MRVHAQVFTWTNVFISLVYVTYLGVQLLSHVASLLHTYFYQFAQLARVAVTSPILRIIAQSCGARCWAGIQPQLV